jgi:hypothetical protein
LRRLHSSQIDRNLLKIPRLHVPLYSHVDQSPYNFQDNRAYLNKLEPKEIPEDKHYAYVRRCRFSKTDKYTPRGEALCIGIIPPHTSNRSLPQPPYRSPVVATHSLAGCVKYAVNQWHEDGVVSVDAPLMAAE